VHDATILVDSSQVPLLTRMVGDYKVSGRFGLASMLASWTIDQTFRAFVRAADNSP